MIYAMSSSIVEPIPKNIRKCSIFIDMGTKHLTSQKKNAIVEKIVVGNSSISELADVSKVSERSISKIKATYKNIIEAKKKKYIGLIHKSGGSLEARAKTIVKSLNAETEVYNFKGQVVGVRPDHKQRLDTVKYIDKLSGFEDTTPKRLTQNNTIINTALDKYTRA
jgi:hypothetical protein